MARTIRDLVDRFYAIVNGAEVRFFGNFHEDFTLGILKVFPSVAITMV